MSLAKSEKASGQPWQPATDAAIGNRLSHSTLQFCLPSIEHFIRVINSIIMSIPPLSLMYVALTLFAVACAGS